MGARLQCLCVPCRRSSETNESASQRTEKARRSRSSNMGQALPRHKLPRSEIRRLQRQTSFKEREILDWYQEFLQSINQPRRDFHLTEEEFVKIYNAVFPGQCKEFAGHIFRTFDLNGDNKVDFREFLIGMSFSGSENLQKRLAWAFQVYDVQGTGFISLENMTRIVRAVFKMIGTQTLRYNDVTITAESLAVELFSQMDTDGDQRVSWVEFREGVLRNPTALQILQCSPPEPGQELAGEDYTVCHR